MMAVVLTVVFIYIRMAGTEALMAARRRRDRMESATATARPAISAGPIRAIRAAWAWVRRNGFVI